MRTTESRYILDKSSKKFVCPQCEKKRFVRFLDIEKREYLPEDYGRCDREADCNYFLNPYADGYAKEIWKAENEGKEFSFRNVRKFKTIPKPQRKPETIFFPFEIYKGCLQAERYEHNIFLNNLLENVPFPFSVKDVQRVIELFYLGTISKGYMSGAVAFPFIDINGNIRTVQAKSFNEKNNTINTNFLHSVIAKNLNDEVKDIPDWLSSYMAQDDKVTCLFGEHLLRKFPKNPIALVEAPKTAIYGTLYFGEPKTPTDLVWLAVYNKSSFSLEKLKVLKGRTVLVFPDLSKDGSTFEEWKTKAQDYQNKLKETRFIFSDLLEQYATNEQRKDGADMADILIQLDWRKFRPIKKYEDYTKQERLLYALNYMYPQGNHSGLKELAEQMFSEKDVMTLRQMNEFLQRTENLHENDREDLIDVMIIRKVLQYDDYNCYKLN